MNDYDDFGSGGDSSTDPQTSTPQAPTPGGQRPSLLGEVDPERESPFVDRDSFAPELAVPKGGGAIRGMGETFSADMFTGSAGMSVPIATSPGRGGFGPSLGLSYSSGAGNGPFGQGWSLGLPAVGRKTDRGLPRYQDDADHDHADVYIFAGAEDLVPERDAAGERVVLESGDFLVHRYRPRTEGGFVRIERWYDRVQDRTHWRSLSRDNLHSFYGRTASRNSTVHDPDQPKHVFRWLLDETRDDRGNIVIYEYKAEDLAGVDMGAPAEANRGGSTTAQRYIKRILYANAVPELEGGWLFELVFDYGEHGSDVAGALQISPSEDRPWPARADAFSSFRSGFDLRTRRLCRRVLMFHRIPELDAAPYLVAATVFEHAENPRATRVDSVTHLAYKKNSNTGNFEPAEFPALNFSYTEAAPASGTKTLDKSALEGLPAQIDGASIRFVDLHGEGLPGILAEHSGAWFYKRPLGDGAFGRPESVPKPTAASLADGARFANLDGAGPRQLVSDGLPLGGYFERRQHDADNAGAAPTWGAFVPFKNLPTADLRDPDAQMIDLAGDGLADLVVARGEYLDWYRSAGRAGYEPGRRVHLPGDERESPRLVFRDPQRAVMFADMSGDGLSDLVCVSRAGVHYWPNRGYGRFGRRTAMAGVGVLDHPDLFSPGRVKLADIDGTGPADLIYLGSEQGSGACTVRYNQAGNGFDPALQIYGFPLAHAAASVDVIDLEGRGTACLVWSSSLGASRGLQLRYIDLVGPQKPNLLVEVDNNRGLVTRTRYAPSTRFYLRDRLEGRPWATCLPYPVQVVDRVETHDQITRQKAVRYYAYHHGYHAPREREFRGFGMVETWDTESFEAFSDADASLFEFEYAPSNSVEQKLHQPPVHTKTWLHTGAFIGWDKVSAIFAAEYYAGDPEAGELPDTKWPAGLSPAEAREAARALRGRTLRSEVYALDGDAEKQPHPYTVSEANFQILALQARGPAPTDHGVFYVHDKETLTHHYDRVPTDPRVSHGFVLEFDDYGTALRSAALVYPRRVATPHPEQTAHHVSLSETSVHHDFADPGRLRLGIPLEGKSFELRGFALPGSGLVAFDPLNAACIAAAEVAYTAPAPALGVTDKRLLSHSRATYYSDDLSGVLPAGQVGLRALPYESLTLALDETQFTGVFGTLDHPPTLAMMQSEGGYRYEAGAPGEGSFWLVSTRAVPDPAAFYAATATIDPFGNTYATTLDAHTLLPTSASTPLANTISIRNDYRLLAPWESTDPNGNRAQVAFDIRGVVIASAIMGKLGDGDLSEGDTLASPTTTFEYDLFRFRDQGLPTFAKQRARITHADPNTEWIESYAYFGGTGQTIMVKAQAEAGLAPKRDLAGALVLDPEGDPILEDTAPSLRWIGNGRTILDNKGQLVRQYEPYFSSTHAYEDEAELVEQGVSPLLHYDPVGRLLRTDFPDGTFSKTETTPWELLAYDANDTVADSSWYATRAAYVGADENLLKEKRAALLALAHHDTPSRMVLDSLGRPFLGIDDLGGGQSIETRALLDVRGQPLAIVDARGNVAEARTYGVLGQVLETSSVDAGDRQGLTCILGQPLRSWDANGQCFRSTYDPLLRPVDTYVQPAIGTEILLSRTLYGESLPSPTTTNHRGRVYRSYAGGGESTTPAYDFKGLPTSSLVKLPLDPTAKNDWTSIAAHTTIPTMATAAAAQLETTAYAASSTHDALGRVLTAISPDSSTVSYAYDQRGSLKTVDCLHRGAASATPVVADIQYDVKGRRQSISYAANATTTTYDYHPLTFRLQAIQTTRTSDGKRLQDLRYHYDPVGNITDIQDDAQQTVYFQNAVVEAANSYTYDATYRLIEATGREHASQGTTQRNSTQLPPDSAATPMANDPNALRRYSQTYSYDLVGNIHTVVHTPSSGTGWTRRYQYATDGNRLVATSTPGDAAGPLYTNTPTYAHTYAHDPHGNFSSMPHLPAMHSDELDQLHHVDVGSLDVYCQYAAGQRFRKYVVHSGSTTEERLYLGSFELYRKRVNGIVKDEWESLHISDDSGRIVLVETRTVQNSSPVASPTGVWRFQLSNHLGSASTEVTETGAVISYEEYHPYGTSAYRLVDSQIDVPAKRYRYTGMERDEETGLGYHAARYYAPWLGRWTAADPIGLGDGVNRFAYASNPVRQSDRSGLAPGDGINGVDPSSAGGTVPSEPVYLESPDGTEFTFDAELVQGDVPTQGESAAAPSRLGEAARTASYYWNNPGDLAFDLADGAVDVYDKNLQDHVVAPVKVLAEGAFTRVGEAIALAQDPSIILQGVVDAGTDLGEGVGQMILGDNGGRGDGYLKTGRAIWHVLGAAVVLRGAFGRRQAGISSKSGKAPPPPPKPTVGEVEVATERAAVTAAEGETAAGGAGVQQGGAATAAGEGGIKGFSAAESSIIHEARGILGAGDFAKLRTAHAAGESATIKIGGRVIQYEPGLPASGMTMFGENGFLIGPEAFASQSELGKTLLHEVHRLSTSASASGVSGSLASQETAAAFGFAERAIGALFK